MNIRLIITQYTVCYIVIYLIEKKEIVMKYSKPKVVAQNKTEGSYAAGCPEKTRYPTDPCSINCEIRR